ncbi:hypothetical protein CPB83DRAFT_291629 [Crepidotus variabilis]|uniref:Uncharacterized protein n=1 Tax=Crepidotus variabilis TaxID=179855 RepID=A0A9P6EG61_9AGAR|nr:hypothetical protein CPB83DRAFT_291629 [Crepidotus variabilis]
MPIAAYTLDQRFKESKIKIMEPTLMFTRSECRPDLGVGRKRPLEEAAIESQPPAKRAKLFAEFSKKKIVQPVKTQSYQPLIPSLNTTAVCRSSGQLEHRSFLSSKPGSKTGKVSQTVKLFESKINQPKLVTLSPPITPVSKRKNRDLRKDTTTPCASSIFTRPSPLNRHTLFWNDLLARAESQVWENGSSDEVLNLKVDDLLRAPGLRVGIFKVNERFLGKQFINHAYP